MDEMRMMSIGLVGAGFSYRGFKAGLDRQPHFIASDAGTSDLGPLQLGTGSFNRRGTKQDLGTLIEGARSIGVPFIMGSAGTAGGDIQVNAVADMDADIVKIRVDDNLGATQKMPPDVYTAVIEQAHARGLRVAAHLYYLDDAKGLLAAGADLVAHSVRDQPVDDALAATLMEQDVCYCPTLMREVSTFVYEERPDWFDDPFFLREVDPAVVQALEAPDYQQRIRDSSSAQAYKVALEQAKSNLKALADAGVRIAMGTDTGPAARFQGYFEHGELDLMVESGLSPMQTIVAATGDAARCLQIDGEVGTLAAGRWADFVVLGANPLDDIRNTRSVESVWIAGNEVPGV